MDRSKHDGTTTSEGAAQAIGGAKILKFVPRAPKLAFVDYGSGWYHQAAIDAIDPGTGAKR